MSHNAELLQFKRMNIFSNVTATKGRVKRELSGIIQEYVSQVMLHDASTHVCVFSHAI